MIEHFMVLQVGRKSIVIFELFHIFIRLINLCKEQSLLKANMLILQEPRDQLIIHMVIFVIPKG